MDVVMENPGRTGYGPNSGMDDDKPRDPSDARWKIQSVRWDDALVNRLLTSIRANPDWASSIARGALTSIDPGSSSRVKAPLSKTDAIREVTRALFEGDPDYDLDDPMVQRSLLVSVRNKLYKLQPLDELLLQSNAKYSEIAAARKEAAEAEAENSQGIRRSLRVPLPRKYAEDLDSDASSSRASPRPTRSGKGQALAAKGGVPRRAAPEPAIRKPWRPPLPLRAQQLVTPARSPSTSSTGPLAPLRTATEIRRAFFENERSYLRSTLERLTKEAEDREKLDEEQIRILRAEIEQREKQMQENRRMYEEKAAKLREKIVNAEEEIRANTPLAPLPPPGAIGLRVADALPPSSASASGSALSSAHAPASASGFGLGQGLGQGGISSTNSNISASTVPSRNPSTSSADQPQPNAPSVQQQQAQQRAGTFSPPVNGFSAQQGQQTVPTV